MKITIYELLEDFDNADLSEYDQHEVWREMILQFNIENDTHFKPERVIHNYLNMKREYEK